MMKFIKTMNKFPSSVWKRTKFCKCYWYSPKNNEMSIEESGSIGYTLDVCVILQIASMDSIVDGSNGKQGQQDKKVRKLKSKLNRDMQAVILKQRNGPIGAEILFTYCAMFNHFAEDELGGVPISDFDCVPDI